nr:hypothetical protein [Tanacetum cinerariifolium]
VFAPFVIISNSDEEITTISVRPAPPSPDRTLALYGYPLDSGDESSYEDLKMPSLSSPPSLLTSSSSPPSSLLPSSSHKRSRSPSPSLLSSVSPSPPPIAVPPPPPEHIESGWDEIKTLRASLASTM